MRSERIKICQNGDCGRPTVSNRHSCSRECGKAVAKAKDLIYRTKAKQDALSHYGLDGVAVCVCCGEMEFLFLTIDHINGGGIQHLKKINKSGGASFCAWLRLWHFPEGYRTLCMNCNAAFGHWGFCPHGNLPPLVPKVTIRRTVRRKIGGHTLSGKRRYTAARDRVIQLDLVWG